MNQALGIKTCTTRFYYKAWWNKYYNKKINDLVSKLKRKEWRHDLENVAFEHLKRVVNNKWNLKWQKNDEGTKLSNYNVGLK